MAWSTGHFPLQCECGILVPRLGKKQQLSAGNFSRVRNGLRINSPVKVQLAPVLLENIVCRVRASSGQEYKSNQNVDELGGNLGCGRRDLLTGLIGALFSSVGTDALAADTPGILNKYIKSPIPRLTFPALKKLDPLETYLPTILLAQSQFQEVDGKLDGEASKFADARSLLRNGPAASLRTDIRAVAQYAAESGNDGGASAAVDQCLSALEDLDGLLLQASRSRGAPIEKMRQRLSTAVTAIDRLLDTVPGAILEKGKAVAKAYRDDD